MATVARRLSRSLAAAGGVSEAARGKSARAGRLRPRGPHPVRFLPGCDSQVSPRCSRPPAKREVAPPRAPPPGGGRRSAQPESLGEGEEAAAAIYRGRGDCGRAARTQNAVPLAGERKWPEPSRPLGSRQGGKRRASSWPPRRPGKARPLPAG